MARQAAFLAVGIMTAFSLMPRAIAADYPTKPIRLALGYSPGGQSDILGRILGKKFTQILGQSVIIDNRPGAGGIIAAEYVARAAPDGYTLLLADRGMMGATQSVHVKLGYNPEKDLLPISIIGSQPFVLVVHPSVPSHSVAELIALAKAKPGKLHFASSGYGVASHLAGELFKKEAHIDIIHVPYKGGGPQLQDTVAGFTEMAFSSTTAALLHIRSGALRALAVTSAKRSAILPDIPTIAESGLPGYFVDSWNGLVAPAGTPSEVIAILYRATVTALNDPDVRRPFTEMGVDIVGNSPEEFQAFIKDEMLKWRPIIRGIGVKAT